MNDHLEGAPQPDPERGRSNDHHAYVPLSLAPLGAHLPSTSR